MNLTKEASIPENVCIVDIQEHKIFLLYLHFNGYLNDKGSQTPMAEMIAEFCKKHPHYYICHVPGHPFPQITNPKL